MDTRGFKFIVRNFLQSRELSVKETFFVKESGEIVTVIITRSKRTLSTESYGFRGNINTISALPSGAPCDACGGTGRAG